VPVPVLVGAPPLETVLATTQVVENSAPEGLTTTSARISTCLRFAMPA